MEKLNSILGKNLRKSNYSYILLPARPELVEGHFYYSPSNSLGVNIFSLRPELVEGLFPVYPPLEGLFPVRLVAACSVLVAFLFGS